MPPEARPGRNRRTAGRLRVQRDEAVFDGETNEGGGVVDGELGHEVPAVFLDGLLAEGEMGGDLTVGVALGDELQHLHLARTQTGVARLRPSGSIQRRRGRSG